MSIDNLKNLHANKEDYPGLNVPDNPDYYLSAAEYNHLIDTLKEFIDDYNIKMSGDRPSQVLPILKTGDPTNLTDDNVLSSLRTIWEISNMLNSFTGMFLSRKNDDSAEGNIKFKKDVFFGDFLSGSLGVTGKGGRITNEGRAELASLSLREWLEVPELRYKRTEVITGDKWRAPGGGIIESVNLLTQELTLKLEDGEYGALEVDDLCMGIFHSMDNSNNATETTDDGRNNRTLKGFATAYFKITKALNPEENNSRFKYELRHISDPSWTRKVHPEKFMHFAAFGNTTKAHRQSSAYETRTYQRFLINMNTWTNDMSNIAAQFGEMENLNTFGTGQTFSGYSVYLNNIYLSGAIEVIKLPYIGEDGYWYIWNNTLGAYVSSGTKAEGKDGEIINAIRYELITSVKEVSRNDAGIPDVPTVFCQILKKDVESDETLNYVPNGHSLYYSINGNTTWHEYPVNSLISISPTVERYDFILKHGDAIVSRAEINVDSGGRLNLIFNPERVSVSVDEDTRAIIDGLPVEIDIIFKYGANEAIAPTEVKLSGPSWLTDALEVSEDKTKILVKEIDFLYSDVNRFNVEVSGKYSGATVSMVGRIELIRVGSPGKSAVVRSLKPSTNIIKRNEAGAPDVNPVFCEVVESLGDNGGFTLGNLPSGYKIKYSKNRGSEIDYAYKGNINVGNPDEVISFFLYNNGIKIDQADILIWPANKKPIYIDSSEAFVPIKVNENYNVISGLPVTIPLNLYYGDDLMDMQSLSINPSVTGITYTTASNKRSITITGISSVPFNNKDSFSFNLVGVGNLHGTTITRTKKVTVQRTFDGIKGDDALIYSLKANNPVLIVGNNGSFKGPNSVKVTILKTVGEDVQVLGAKPDGYTLQYKKNSGSAVTYTYNSNIALTTTDTQITFELLKGSTLIDTITIPILKDGINGEDGINGKDGEEGDSPIIYELQPSVTQIKKLANGTLVPSTISCRMIVTSANGSSSTTTLPYFLSAERSLDNGATWSNYTLGTSINTALINTSVQFRLYQDTSPITMLDIETIMIVEDGEHGEDGNSPFIGANGNWYVWDSALKKYVDSGDSAHGDDGHSPEIRNGYWWVYENGQWSNTGIKAQGEDGHSPYIGENGNWFIWDSAQNKYVDSGDSAHGDDGKSPEIRDGYWWVYENGQWSNTGIKAEGKDGQDGKDGYTPIKGTDYFDGKNGQDGTSEHLHIRYSMSPDGSNFDIDPSNKLYIGITTSTTGVAPTLKTKYNWTLIKGSDGVKGEKGTDGESRYLHIKYSDNGTSFTANMGETLGSWIGMYVDKIEKDSTRFDDYTWRKVDGEDGENAKWLKLNSTATQIKVDRNNNSLPASITVFAQLYNMSGTATWTYSVNGGNFTSTLPTGVARTGNRITVTSASVTFQVLSIKAVMGNAEDTVSISRVVDGERGVPGKSPVTKEYRVGQTYYNNDIAVHYVYYRAGNSWWKLKDSVESHAASTSAPSTVYFEQLSSVEVMVAETIIAENANLAEFIFKDKKMFSQLGTNSAGDSIKLGEYVQFQFGIYNSTTPPASNWSGWNNTPPTTSGNYLWIRYKITSESVWVVKRVTGTDPDFTVQFGALKDGTFSNPPYQAGRNWMKMSDGRLYAITEELALGDYDPNMLLDGFTGKSIMNNISLKGSIGINPKIINSGNVSNYMKWINYKGVSRYGLILNEDIGFNLTFIDVSFDEIAHIIFPTGSEAFKYIGLEANIINYTNTSSNFIRAIDVNTDGSNYTDLHQRSFLRVICVPMGATVAWVKLAEIHHYS